MKRLWAPWRLQYVKQEPKGCIFCQKPKNKDKDALILCRTRHAYSMLNIYPYTNGHLMVAPFRHVASLVHLTKAERADLIDLVSRMEGRLREVYNPGGFNIGMNLGRVAGAGYAEHIHVHIVPRWNGDTNFMPVIGDVKIIPDSLENVYWQLINSKV